MFVETAQLSATKKKKILDSLISDVVDQIETLQAFAALSGKQKKLVISQLQERHGYDSKQVISQSIVTNIARFIKNLGKDNDSWTCRLIIAASILSEETDYTTQGVDSHPQIAPANSSLGTAVSIRPETIYRAEKVVTETSSQIASELIRRKPEHKQDPVFALIKAMAQDYVIMETRESPNPGDNVIVKLNGRTFLVTARYLKCTKSELYKRFIRDMRNIAIRQNPSLHAQQPLTDHRLVSKGLFLSWLREWTFVKPEVWYVCICKLCYNIQQYLKTYFKVTVSIHGHHSGLEKKGVQVPIRRSDVVVQTCMESEDNESNHEDLYCQSREIECKDSACSLSPMRRSDSFEIPFTGLDAEPIMTSYARTPTAAEWLKNAGVICSESSYDCSVGKCTLCGPQRAISKDRFLSGLFCMTPFSHLPLSV